MDCICGATSCRCFAGGVVRGEGLVPYRVLGTQALPYGVAVGFAAGLVVDLAVDLMVDFAVGFAVVFAVVFAVDFATREPGR